MTAESAARNAGQPIQPYLVICRDCGDAVAVRMASGRIVPLGEVEVTEDRRIVVVCPVCGRDNRIGNTRAVDRMRRERRQ